MNHYQMFFATHTSLAGLIQRLFLQTMQKVNIAHEANRIES